MMDESALRSQWAELQTALVRNHEEREALLWVRRGLEKLHNLSPAGRTSLSPAPLKTKRPMVSASPGPTFRSIALAVVKDAGGEALHADEILRRIIIRGGVTRAKRPLEVVDLVLGQLFATHPVERTAPRTWRWKGEAAAVSTNTMPVGVDDEMPRWTVERAGYGDYAGFRATTGRP